MTDNKSPEGAPDVYVGSIPSLPKMRPIQEVTAPLFEDDQEGEDADEPAIGGTADEDELEEAEIEDEQDADKSTISQINSLDPA